MFTKIIDNNQNTRTEKYKKLTEYVVGINQKCGAPRIVLETLYDNGFSKSCMNVKKFQSF